jgi:hypothetical protein
MGRNLLLLLKMSHHLDLEIESGGRCVYSLHGCASGCEESRSVGAEGCESVVEASESVRA